MGEKCCLHWKQVGKGGCMKINCSFQLAIQSDKTSAVSESKMIISVSLPLYFYLLDLARVKSYKMYKSHTEVTSTTHASVWLKTSDTS